MSLQSGRWNFDGRPVEPEYFAKVSELTARYSPYEEMACFREHIGMLYRPFPTTEQSEHESQPLEDRSGFLLTWDGRLDNRDELLSALGLDLRSATPLTDAQIVRSGYRKWSTGCFQKLSGDWAMTIWDPQKEQLILGRDFIGVRHLFYCVEKHQATWSTILDPLVLLAGRKLRISEEYVAGYLSTYPSEGLTPFDDIVAVPAATFVEIGSRKIAKHRYWSFNPSNAIRYRTDAEYEEHFRVVFGQAVRRRLRSEFPVCAELSGGMDSSAIVCMADREMTEANTLTKRLDTLSYYDEAEPNWNERPYFSLIERKRGRKGHHIQVGINDGAFEALDEVPCLPFPGYDKSAWNHVRRVSHCLESGGNRVLLSGIGGDELLGGVPAPKAELQTLFLRLRWTQFLRQLYRWSLRTKCPLTHLCFETLEEFLPQQVRKLYKRASIPGWLAPQFVRQNARLFWNDMPRTQIVGPSPVFQANIVTLNHLRRQLNCSHLTVPGNYRVAYPYLDRDLLAFLFAIPRDQVIRPYERRSLMRRALQGIVPPEILGRKRKAFISRQPRTQVDLAFRAIRNLLLGSFSVSCGWVERASLSEAISAATEGIGDNVVPLLDLLKLELWLQVELDRTLLDDSYPSNPKGPVSEASALSTLQNPRPC